MKADKRRDREGVGRCLIGVCAVALCIGGRTTLPFGELLFGIVSGYSLRGFFTPEWM